MMADTPTLPGTPSRHAAEHVVRHLAGPMSAVLRRLDHICAAAGRLVATHSQLSHARRDQRRYELRTRELQLAQAAMATDLEAVCSGPVDGHPYARLDRAIEVANVGYQTRVSFPPFSPFCRKFHSA